MAIINKMQIDTLLQSKFFQKLHPTTVDAFLQHGQLRRYHRGNLILSAREKNPFIFFSVSGKTMVYNLTHDGKQKTLFILKAGVLLNESILSPESVSTFCEALEAVTVLAIPQAVFLDCMEHDFALTKAVLAAAERRVWRLNHQLKNTIGSIHLERKLAAKLWKLARDFGIPSENGIEIDLNLSVTFLADMLGASRETTSRVCTTLVNHGLISMQNKQITIHPEECSIFYRTGKFPDNPIR